MRPLPLSVCLTLVLSGWFPACSQSASTAAPASASAPASKDSKVLAVVGGQPITEDDLDIAGQLLQVEQQRYEIVSHALDNAIAQKLLEEEAARRGVTLEALLKTEVESKVVEPTDKEVEDFYQQQKERIRRPFEEIRPQLAGALRTLKAGKLQDDLVASLRAKADVEMRLEPLRVPVDLSHAPLRGPADAPVTVVEFSDFQCPFCHRVQPVIQELRRRYAKQVNWRFKDLPLISIHPGAQSAAEAARCAGEQGKFWEYRDALFQAPQINREMHKGMAESLGLDSEPFLKCLQSEKYRDAVQADSQEAQDLGITGTPTFVIDGIVLAGAQPLEEFTRVIDSELRRKGVEPPPATP